jgi:hypothetical protein
MKEYYLYFFDSKQTSEYIQGLSFQFKFRVSDTKFLKIKFFVFSKKTSKMNLFWSSQPKTYQYYRQGKISPSPSWPSTILKSPICKPFTLQRDNLPRQNF